MSGSSTEQHDAPQPQNAAAGPAGAPPAGGDVPVELEGQFEHIIDAKGRMSLPVHFRTLLNLTTDSKVIAMRQPGKSCIAIYTKGAWEIFKSRVRSVGSAKQKLALKQVMQGTLRELSLDSMGRILMPVTLRRAAGLVWEGEEDEDEGKNKKMECIVIGQGAYMEVWLPAVWEREHPQEDFAGLDFDDVW